METNRVRHKVVEKRFVAAGDLRLIAFDSICVKNFISNKYFLLLEGLHVGSLESILALINVRFSHSLRYIELPIELITHTVFHELAGKCPNLTHMLLDFSSGKFFFILLSA